jgi:hypothetical protein
MSERRVLPQRRAAETFTVEWGGMAGKFAVTLGYYENGELGEIFINGGKSGEQVEAIARDAAVILSMALQFGARLETIAAAVTRDSQGAPSSIIGAVLDELTRRSDEGGD